MAIPKAYPTGHGFNVDTPAAFHSELELRRLFSDAASSKRFMSAAISAAVCSPLLGRLIAQHTKHFVQLVLVGVVALEEFGLLDRLNGLFEFRVARCCRVCRVKGA